MAKIALIILNYNCYPKTKDCVMNLININIKQPIVIVDNKSIDNSYVLLKKKFQGYSNISVIQSEKNGGYSYGNNFGIKYILAKSKIDYICILNPDVILPQNYFSRLINDIKDNPNAVAISTVMFLDNHFNTGSLPWSIPKASQLYQQLSFKKNKPSSSTKVYPIINNSLVKTETLPGSFFMIKESFFSEIGFFDENVFLYNEENILGIKIKNRGKYCVLDTSLYYLHNHKQHTRKEVILRYKQHFGEILEEHRNNYQSRMYLCKRYYAGKGKLKIHLAYSIGLPLLYIKRMLILLKR